MFSVTEHYEDGVQEFIVHDKDVCGTEYKVAKLDQFDLYEVTSTAKVLDKQFVDKMYSNPQNAVNELKLFLKNKTVTPTYRARRRKDLEEENAKVSAAVSEQLPEGIDN